MPAKTMDGDRPAWIMPVDRGGVAGEKHENLVGRQIPFCVHITRLRLRGRTTGILAVALLAAIAGRACAGYSELDEGWRLAADGRVDAAWVSDLSAEEVQNPVALRQEPAPVDSDIAGVSSIDWQARFAQEGEYLDRFWYELADKWQYYYLDYGQYNLLGGLSYLLGHPCYPKWFERPIDQAVGFGGQRHVFWFGISSYLPTDSAYVWLRYGQDGLTWWPSIAGSGFGSPLGGGGLHFVQTAGDHIDRWRYAYLDNWLYRDLDTGQYRMLGGLSYMFGRASFSLPAHYMSSLSLQAGAGYYRVPEPATILLLALGTLGAFRSRLRGCRLR